MTERRYTVDAVSINRYSKEGPYKATVNAYTYNGHKIEVQLPEERVSQIIDLIADLILEAVQEQFGNMREDHLLGLEEQRAKEAALEDHSTSS